MFQTFNLLLPGDGAAQRGAPAPLRRGPLRGAAAAGGGRPRTRPAGRSHAPSPQRALRRPAAARGHRPGAGHPPLDSPRRRADRQPRQQDRRGGPGALRAACTPRGRPSSWSRTIRTSPRTRTGGSCFATERSPRTTGPDPRRRRRTRKGGRREILGPLLVRHVGHGAGVWRSASSCSIRPTAAADTLPRPITLEEAVALARQNAPAIIQAEGQKRTSDADVRSAYAAFLPSVSLSAGATRQLPAPGSRTRIENGQVITVPSEPVVLQHRPGGERHALRGGRAHLRSAAGPGPGRPRPRSTKGCRSTPSTLVRQAAVLRRAGGPRNRDGGPGPARPGRTAETRGQSPRSGPEPRPARTPCGPRSRCATPGSR